MKDLGQLVVTSSIDLAIINDSVFNHEIKGSLERYMNHDWGETSEDGVELNNDAVINNDDQILAVYNTSRGDIWIITEWDRSVTTILFPSEY